MAADEPDSELLDSLLAQFTNHTPAKKARVVPLARDGKRGTKAATSNGSGRRATNVKAESTSSGSSSGSASLSPEIKAESPASPTLSSGSGSTAARGEGGDPFLGVPAEDALVLDSATLLGGSPRSQYLADDDFSDRDNSASDTATSTSPAGTVGHVMPSAGSLSPPVNVLPTMVPVADTVTGNGGTPQLHHMPEPIYLVPIADPGQPGLFMFQQMDLNSGLSLPMPVPLSVSGFSPVSVPALPPTGGLNGPFLVDNQEPAGVDPSILRVASPAIIEGGIPRNGTPSLLTTGADLLRAGTPQLALVPIAAPEPVDRASLGKRKRGRPRKSAASEIGVVSGHPIANVESQPGFVLPQMFMAPSSVTPPSAQKNGPAGKAAAGASPGVVGADGRTLKKPRSSHNEIEKRYRENINERMRELRDVVPALAAAAATEADAMEDDGDNSGEGGKGSAKKLHKATILKGATDHIRLLTAENVQLRAELEGLRALLSGAAPLQLAGWHAAPVPVAPTSDAASPSGTMVPFTMMALAGMLFLGGSSGPEMPVFGGESGSTHVDVGVVLGRNATLVDATSSALALEGSFAWLWTLLRTLLGLYCVLHIVLSVFVFPKKGAKAAKQAGQIVADSTALAFGAKNVSAAKGDKAEESESSVGFPDGSVLAARHARLRALRIYEQGTATSAAAKLLLTAAIHSVLARDSSSGLDLFEKALEVTSSLAVPQQESELSWLVRDKALTKKFWTEAKWRGEFLATKDVSGTLPSPITLSSSILAAAFRKWMARSVLSRSVTAVVQGSKPETFAALEATLKNLCDDAQTAKDDILASYMGLSRAIVAAWSDAAQAVVADAIAKIAQGSETHPMAPLTLSVCVAVLAHRRDCSKVEVRAGSAAQAALAEVRNRRRRSPLSPRSEDEVLDFLLELVLCLSLVACRGNKTDDANAATQHLRRLFAVAPAEVRKEASAIFHFVEQTLN